MVDLDFARPNGLQVLEGIDLSVQPGEVVAVVGPSGCGKSTLLSLVAGLLTPSSGHLVHGSGARSAERRRRPTERWLTLMFQEETLLPWRTVEKNVAFGLERLQLSRRERTERTRQLLAMVGLQEFASSLPMELSGGMRRRVQFATCAAPYPRLLLLDEPFSALDEPTRVSLHADVLKTVYELGIAVVLVTHDIAEAVTLADRIVVLSSRPGRIVDVVPVPFGRERDVLTLRETPEYAELYRVLWHQIWTTFNADADRSARRSAEGADRDA